MTPKTGIIFPTISELGSYPHAIAYALKSELGATHQTVKIVMSWTGAGERTVKNWLSGVSGPSGQHLVDILRHSDFALRVILMLADRRPTIAAQNLASLRESLIDAVRHIDQGITLSQGDSVEETEGSDDSTSVESES